MARLVIVSNRVNAPRERSPSAGGLAVAMRDALRQHGGLWFGWSGEIATESSTAPEIVQVGRTTYALVDLSDTDHAAYYNGYANSTLWPLLHYRLGLVGFRRADVDGYHRVNARMAACLKPLLRPDDLIWVHDYHLIPMGAELRRIGIEARIGFFLHTPFSVAAVLEALPSYQRLLATFFAYDLVGLQTLTDLRAFREAMTTLAGAAPHGPDRLRAVGRTTRIGAFPIGIDVDGVMNMAEKAAASPESRCLQASLSGRALIIGADRLDYSKGLPQRFGSFGRLLADHPEHRGRVTYLQITPHSRSDVAQYKALRRELESSAGRINGRHAEVDWVPLRYLNKNVQRATLVGYFRTARVGLVTPLRDGMNLVAKEFVAAQDPADPGVLVLSRFAGAAQELSAALLVNPIDEDEIAASLHAALTMPHDERCRRWESLMAALRSNTAVMWRERYLATLAAAPVAVARRDLAASGAALPAQAT